MILAISFLTFGFFFVPELVGFSYVQTVLGLMGWGVEFSKKNKDIYYLPYTVLMVLPIGLFPWVEGLLCDSFLIHIGGHVWFDAIIPISMTVYFFYVRKL